MATPNQHDRQAARLKRDQLGALVRYPVSCLTSSELDTMRDACELLDRVRATRFEITAAGRAALRCERRGHHAWTWAADAGTGQACDDCGAVRNG